MENEYFSIQNTKHSSVRLLARSLCYICNVRPRKLSPVLHGWQNPGSVKDLREGRPRRPHPYGPKISQFHNCGFFENCCQNRRLVPPPGGLAPPPMGNPGSASADSYLSKDLCWIYVESILQERKVYSKIMDLTHSTKSWFSNIYKKSWLVFQYLCNIYAILENSK